MVKIPALILVEDDGLPDLVRRTEDRLQGTGIEIAHQAPTLSALGGRTPPDQQVLFGRAPKSAFDRALPGITLCCLGPAEPLPGAEQEGSRHAWHAFHTGWMHWQVEYGVRNGQPWWFITLLDAAGRTAHVEQVRLLYAPAYGPDVADIARLGSHEEMLAQRMNLPWPPDTVEMRAAG